MKVLAVMAAVLALSTTQAQCVCKHHFAGLAMVSDFGGPLASPAVGLGPLFDIKKCAPYCGS
jgi:hypothetical protein